MLKLRAVSLLSELLLRLAIHITIFVIPRGTQTGAMAMGGLPAEYEMRNRVYTLNSVIDLCYNISLRLEVTYGRGTAESKGACSSGTI